MGNVLVLRFIQPMKPSLSEVPPKGENWLHEVKYDGYRTQVIVERGQSKAFSSTGLDWTRKYPAIVEAAAALPVDAAIIDGEAISIDDRQRSDFRQLVKDLGWAPRRISLVAFDLLHLDGEDLRKRPLRERREKLRALLGEAAKQPGAAIQFSEHQEGHGEAFFAAVERAGLEGIVSKRPDSTYRSGSSRDAWLKTKCFEQRRLEIIGVQREPGKAAIAILADKGRPVGSAFLSLKGIRERLYGRMKVSRPARGAEKKNVEWIEPIPATVKTLRGEHEGLRHASVLDLPED